ncbi:UPF0175 family protein [Azonexus hydrophilus]|uniref:UPF0175 family protein n=1 Tax=Azonexus hydrophilus TaxID=418702 RepID=UPI00048AED06|nr:UPF0175 family protein [Azonexus hydrophilus]
MHTFKIRNLRKHVGKLIRRAESGRFSLVTKRGVPLFVAVPCDEMLISDGLGTGLAIKLFVDERISLGRAARLVGVSISEMIDILGVLGVAVIRPSEEELDRELADFG